jgi:predicted aspartyl protease
MTFVFDEKTKVEFTRMKDGHIYLNVTIVCEGSSDGDAISFIYDTGAYITVLNRDRYEYFKLNKLPRIETVIGGYSGGAPGYLFKIPGLMIGVKLLVGVWAFSPKSSDLRHNLLGSNVIEYFRPFQDNMNDVIYFPDNLSPKPYFNQKYNVSLACDRVLFIET